LETCASRLDGDFPLDLTVAGLVEILGGSSCAFFYREQRIFEDAGRPVVSYPLGTGPVYVQFNFGTSRPPRSTTTLSCNLIVPPYDQIITFHLELDATVADAIKFAQSEIGEGPFQLADDVQSEPLDGNMRLAELPEPRDLFVITTTDAKIR
jgi:hypothetical protein